MNLFYLEMLVEMLVRMLLVLTKNFLVYYLLSFMQQIAPVDA